MILPPTGGPPPKGAAVRGRMERETLEPLKHIRLPGVTRLTPHLPPPPSARRRTSPQAKGAVLALSLSLSLFCSKLTHSGRSLRKHKRIRHHKICL